MKTYTVYYNDGTYLSYTFDEAQFNQLCSATADSRHTVIKGVGMFVTKDIRSVIEVKPVLEEPEENASYDPDFTDAEKEYFEQMKLAERLHKETEPDDSDYEGGMMP